MKAPTNNLSLLAVLLIISSLAWVSYGCFPEPYKRQSRARSFDVAGGGSRSSSINDIGRIFTLNSGEAATSVRPNLSAYQGQAIFGRLIVPWPTSAAKIWTLEVLAYWSEHFNSAPLWLFIKKDGIPSTTDFDKSGISFTSRGFSRIRLHEAEPGSYFVMVEAMQDIRNLTMEVNLINTDSQAEESMRSSSSYWPRRISIP